MNSQIAEATYHKGEVAEEINPNVVNISEVAVETASGADQLGEASTELANLSNKLQLLVSRFKV